MIAGEEITLNSVLNFHFNCPFGCAKAVFFMVVLSYNFWVISMELPALTKALEPIRMIEVLFSSFFSIINVKVKSSRCLCFYIFFVLFQDNPYSQAIQSQLLELS